MDRRRFLQSTVLGTLPAVAGCLEFRPPPKPAVSSSEVTTGYPLFSAAHYDVTARRVDDLESTPISFEDLPAGARVELANAISRDRYVVGRSPELLSADLHREVLSYRGSTFEVSIGVADTFSEPVHGPDGDPDWVEPVEVTASVEGDELTVTAANELDTGLAVHHSGRPYFGVLVAVSETPSVLGHGSYEENEHVQTSGIVTTERIRGEALQTETLSPGDSLREFYALPDDLSGESTVWFALTIGDDSIELFGNRNTLLTATIPLEA